MITLNDNQVPNFQLLSDSEGDLDDVFGPGPSKRKKKPGLKREAPMQSQHQQRKMPRPAKARASVSSCFNT